MKKDLSQIQKLCEKLDNDIGNGIEGSIEIKARIAHIEDNNNDSEEIDNVSYNLLIEYKNSVNLTFYPNIGKKIIGYLY